MRSLSCFALSRESIGGLLSVSKLFGIRQFGPSERTGISKSVPIVNLRPEEKGNGLLIGCIQVGFSKRLGNCGNWVFYESRFPRNDRQSRWRKRLVMG